MRFYVADTDTHNTAEIYDEKELSDVVYNSLKYYHDRANRLHQENMKLISDAKSVVEQQLLNEVASLRERLELSYGEFASYKEKKAYEKFVKKHMHDRADSKYNSGRVPYLIPTGTGVGTILKVKCPICEEIEDITDLGVW